MAIRINCKFCKAALTFDDDKAGKKVRCRKCEEVLSLPAAAPARKKQDDEAIAEKPRVKLKARSRDEDDREDDDEDDRPRKKKQKAEKGSPVMMLAIGGGVLGLLMLLGVGSVAGYFIFRKPAPANERLVNNQVAEANPPMVQEQGQGLIDPGPQPVATVAPKPQVDPNAGKALPDALAADTLTRVKQATAYVRVTMPNGATGTGTGFLAIEPDLVITNAHVVGMMQANAQPPQQIEIILNSGQPNELKMAGQLLGVDRGSDLAVIKVKDKNLPPPLFVDAERKLTETQKVYVFGFPFGESLGKAITVSESSVTSLRLDKRGTGELGEIQVNGGIQPGNSGGPVVNANGSVVGVAVSYLKGTQINFAIPAAKIHKAMNGSVVETTLLQAILENGQSKLPIKVQCLDPLQRISQVRVDVWTGMPGQSRPSSAQQPQPMPGDGARQTHSVSYQNGVGTSEVPLPPPNPGQVYWLQPVVTNAVGNHWGEAVTLPVNLYPIERKPAALNLDFTKVKERTIKLKSLQGIVLSKGGEKKIIGDRVVADLLEVVYPDPVGFKLRTCFGSKLDLSAEIDGKVLPVNKQVLKLVRQLAPQIMIDPTGTYKNHRGDQGQPVMPANLKDDVIETYGLICNSMEAILFPMPNRQVNPLETWQTTVILPLRSNSAKGKKVWVRHNLALTCTFEGVRTRDQRSEGVITVKGKVMGAGVNANKTAGDVTGSIALDLNGGFISSGQVKINSELETGNADVGAAFVFEIDLTREAGNSQNIQMPPENRTPKTTPKGIPIGPTPPMPPPGGKLLVQQMGTITLADPADPLFMQKKKKTRFKLMPPMKLEANKTYVISLNSTAFDPFLRLHNQTGPVAMDDNSGGGKNARITFRPPQSGFFQIVVISHDGRVGNFELTVSEMP